jgi:hypothetical protein
MTTSPMAFGSDRTGFMPAPRPDLAVSQHRYGSTVGPGSGPVNTLIRIGVISVRQSGCSSGLGWQRGGEKLGEQLVDSVSLVVMDPMGGAGQPLDAVEVGYIVVLGLG